MLLIPLATGAVVAAGSSINSLALTLFVTATLALFWLRMPIKAWIGTSPIKVRTRQECGSSPASPSFSQLLRSSRSPLFFGLDRDG